MSGMEFAFHCTLDVVPQHKSQLPHGLDPEWEVWTCEVDIYR